MPPTIRREEECKSSKYSFLPIEGFLSLCELAMKLKLTSDHCELEGKIKLRYACELDLDLFSQIIVLGWSWSELFELYTTLIRVVLSCEKLQTNKPGLDFFRGHWHRKSYWIISTLRTGQAANNRGVLLLNSCEQWILRFVRCFEMPAFFYRIKYYIPKIKGKNQDNLCRDKTHFFYVRRLSWCDF